MKMFGFIKKKKFFTGLTVLLSLNPLNATQLKYVSMNNQDCKVRPEIVNVYSDEPVFYFFSIKTSKCIGNCDKIIGPYTKMCVPDVIKKKC